MHELTYFISYERRYCFGQTDGKTYTTYMRNGFVHNYSDTVGEQMIQHSWQSSTITVKGWWVGFSMQTCDSGTSQANDILTRQNQGRSSQPHNVSVHTVCC